MISAGILILFVIHAVTGGFMIAGLMPGGSRFLSILSWIMLVLIALHLVMGVILTAQSISAAKKAGVSYRKENRLFWTRRISGFAIIIFILMHLLLFMGHQTDGVFRLNVYELPQLISQLLLVVSIAVHLISNIRPLIISLGIRSVKKFSVDILFVLSIILVFAAGAFLIYYIRWL